MQLYALTLCDSLLKNVPARVVQPELSSRAFCTTLQRLVTDRTTHALVRARALKLIKEWAESMQRAAAAAGEDDNGNGTGAIMKETYETLKKQSESTALQRWDESLS